MGTVIYATRFIVIAGVTIILSHTEKNIGHGFSGGNNQLPACTHSQDSTPLTQSIVISRYISVLLYHPLTREKHGKQSSFTSLSTVMNDLVLLWNASYTVMRTCGWKNACICDKSNCTRSHNVIPCGNIFHISWEAVSVYQVEVPFGLHVNITLLYMTGHMFTQECHVTQRLTLAELSTEGREIVVYTICGKTPVQNFFMATNRVRVRLVSKISYETAASFCLIYQATAIKHAHLMDAATINNMSSDGICRSCSNKCLRPNYLDLGGPILNGTFVYGHTWIYTWAFADEILKTPTVEIQKFDCGSIFGGLSNSRLRIIDGPFSVYDQHFSSGLFTFLLDQGCGHSLLRKSFTGSIGDLVLQAIWDSQHTFELKFDYNLVDIRCPAELCTLQKYRLSNHVPMLISAASDNQTSQTRLLITLDNSQNKFIELQDAVFHYDGLGHLQCAIGGIYIYELDSVSLITRICSPWTSAIWSRTSKKWNSNSVHFGKGPVLILIRSYRNAGSGYVSGAVQLSDCKGIVNSLLRPNAEHSMRKPQGVLTYKTYITMASFSLRKQCTVIRESRVDGRGSWASQEKVGMLIEVEREGMELSVVDIRGCFNLPQYVNVYREVYNYEFSKQLPCTMARLYKGKEMVVSAPIYIKEYVKNRSCFRLEQAFTEEHWGLDFDISCFLMGLKLTVDVRAINATGLNCSSSNFLQQSLLNFREEVVAFTSSLPCGSMEFYGKLSNYEFQFNKPIGLLNCCYLKVTARASQRFLDMGVKEISYSEGYNLIDLQHSENSMPSVLNIDLKSYHWKFGQTSYSAKRSRFPNESFIYRSGHTSNDKVMQRQYTVDTSIWTPSFSINPRRSNVSGQGEYLKISFRHFSIGRPKSQWQFSKQHRLRWKQPFCIDLIRSCYKVYKLASSSWRSANELCAREGLHLISINNEIEWQLVQYWFSKELTTAYKLRKSQLIFLGTQIRSVSNISNYHS